MKKTQLIVYKRPYNAILGNKNESKQFGADYNFALEQNPNYRIDAGFQDFLRPQSGQGLEVDLYENVSIPITFSILDIREPEKRKTSWSKSVLVPGTTNNNRIFSHIYEIGQDGWITVGGRSIYSGFNPNLRTEVILLNDGIQVLKGNMQLKKITKDKNGNIEYEIAINGDLTSLFYDVGTSKLSDLDFSEWDHNWTRTNIASSWTGTIRRNDATYQSISIGTLSTITKFYLDTTTGRLGVETSAAHNYSEGDNVRLVPDTSQTAVNPNNLGVPQSNLFTVLGDFIITKITSATKFVVNFPYPVGLPSTGYFPSLAVCGKTTATGKGYVYPMISWGAEFDFNSFPVTSFVPGFYVKEILDKIMKQTNSSYDSTFLNSQFFKRQILIQRRPTYDLNPSEVEERRFRVGTTQSYTTGAAFTNVCTTSYPNFTNSNTSATSSIFPSALPNRMPFKAETSTATFSINFFDNGTSNGNIGNWDQDQYKWIIKEEGEYKLAAKIGLSALCVMNGYNSPPGSSGTSSFFPGTRSYYPGDPQVLNQVAPGPLPAGETGLIITATLKRSRAGVISTIGSSSYQFQMNRSSVWSPTNTNWKNFGTYQPTSWENVNLTVESSSFYFSKNDECWVEITHYVQAKPGTTPPDGPTRKTSKSFWEVQPSGLPKEIRGEWFYDIKSLSYVFNEPSEKSVEGGLINASSFLPKDMTCKDFLLGIIKMFNLHIEPDRQVERKYYIEPRDDYYYDNPAIPTQVEDWSQKIDESSVELTPMGELIAKYYVFENKEETDFWNQKFKDDRGRPYSQYTKEVENDFLKNEAKITIPFGTTIMINNPEDSDVVIPAIIQRETNGSFKPVSNSAPRILIYGGLRPYTAGRGGSTINLQNPQFPQSTSGWELLSSLTSTSASASIYNYYPYAGTVDQPLDPLYDLNWYNMEEGDFVYFDHARWTNENLYNKYWKRFIDEVSDPSSKVLTANFYLTPKDIFNLDFRKIYLVDGNLFRLQKVYDYDPVNEGLTKCELLKLKSGVKFVRRTLFVDGAGNVESTFNERIDQTRAITTTVKEVAPRKKKPEYGFGNTTPGSQISNNGTITTSGLSNFVASGSKNVKINGNENVVGNNANNVHISSGNGNFISGNVKNVNIIGTDKKFVTESDVTYINGIRYKNGIAISKANVINGGQDVAVVRQSDSTTANVLNAGEDVVITGGSSAQENVVNAGIDSILPDVAELGIVSTTNPNPRTNLSDGFRVAELNLATQSLVTLVRERQAQRA